MWCNRSSANLNASTSPVEVAKNSVITPFFSRGSVSLPKFLYELWIGRGEGERPQASDGISQLWPVILMPKTVLAGTGEG